MDSNKVIDDGSVKVLSASAGKGRGEFDFKFPSNALTLNVDASTAKSGTYTSTLTWDLVQAPEIIENEKKTSKKQAWCSEFASFLKKDLYKGCIKNICLKGFLLS